MSTKGSVACSAVLLSLADWQIFLPSHSKYRPVISSFHMIQFTEYGSCLEVKLNYLYTDELPHLPMVTFVQSSHCLKAKWNWHTARGKKLWIRTPCWLFVPGFGSLSRAGTGTSGYRKSRFMSGVRLKKWYEKWNCIFTNCVGIGLTSKTCHPLGSIARDMAPQIHSYWDQPNRMDDDSTAMSWECYYLHHVWCPTSKKNYNLNTWIIRECSFTCMVPITSLTDACVQDQKSTVLSVEIFHEAQ